VLADGLWQHTAQTDTAFETDVQLPNINCKKCTLQVVQFMAEHSVNNPGNFTYHHCADLQIVADPTKPIDKGWPPETLPRILDIGWPFQSTPWWLALRAGANPFGETVWAMEDPLVEQRKAWLVNQT
jgi:hypothetical protein